MGSSPISGIMTCVETEKNLTQFIRKTLSGNALRRTYYHIIGCKKCREALLDEFSFYTTFNDLDKDLDFNYDKQCKKLLNDIGSSIKKHDNSLRTKYVAISISFCIIAIILVGIAVRFVYV